MLTGSCIEKEVQFAGILPEIPMTLDPSSRAGVLLMIDKGLREKHLTPMNRLRFGVTLCIDVNSMKLFSKDKQQEPVLRMPIHQVAAISYIKEDDQHILSIKFGEVSKSHAADETLTCSLAVLYCDSRTTAEQICAYFDLCFQSMYTDTTINFLNTSSGKGSQISCKEKTPPAVPNSNGAMVNLPQLRNRSGSLGFMSHSSLDLGYYGSTGDSEMTQASESEINPAESEISPAANELILDYMRKLFTKLDPSEVQEFAKLVKAWHTNMLFPEFCQKVLDVYGHHRKHLLVGMRPFIPAKDSTYFEHFLQCNGCGEDEAMLNSQLAFDSNWRLDGQQQCRRDSFSSLTDSFEMIDCSSIMDEDGSKSSHNRS